ncbi:unnamed protein product [Adineta ricciae]|uniref:Uncharacterized protein n=1 Tax=Adineta ricciae TaxID=249248 RepID=A0A815TCF1_ADIRI|nr:unnamed protein product [Adineta ricciae]
MPSLQYLYITVQHEKCIKEPYLKHPQPQIEFCEKDIRQMTDASRLRTVVLRHMALHNVIILIRSLNMPLLEKLILVEIFHETLEHYEEFRQIINRKYLPCLKQFHFLLRFPEYLHEEFQQKEQDLPCYGICKKKTRVILLYTLPLDILLQYTCIIYSHSFAQHSLQINRDRIGWKCNEIHNVTQFTDTFNKLATGYVDTLVVQFYEMKVIKRSERAYIIDQILQMSPCLLQLTVEWEDLSLCSHSNTNVKHLRLELNKSSKDPNTYIHIDFLVQLLPRICCFETSGRYLYFNENLVRFVIKIIDTIDRLVQLIINKYSLLRRNPKVEASIEEAIFKGGNEQLLNYKICQIRFPSCTELRIWLS